MENHHESDQENMDDDYTAEDVAYLAHHKIDTLIELLIQKKIVTEAELKKKSEELSVSDEEFDEEEED